MKLSIEQRKQLADRIEQKIGDMLRDEGVLLDGYMLREVESVSLKLAHDAVMKRNDGVARCNEALFSETR